MSDDIEPDFTLTEAILGLLSVLCLLGALLFFAFKPISKEQMMDEFESWNPQEQQDFIIEAITGKDTLKREIAEDWCAINKQTQRVCWNARMLNPIRGVK